VLPPPSSFSLRVYCYRPTAVSPITTDIPISFGQFFFFYTHVPGRLMGFRLRAPPIFASALPFSMRPNDAVWLSSTKPPSPPSKIVVMSPPPLLIGKGTRLPCNNFPQPDPLRTETPGQLLYVIFFFTLETTLFPLFLDRHCHFPLFLSPSHLRPGVASNPRFFPIIRAKFLPTIFFSWP